MINSCLFLCPDCAIILYVDDTILIAKDSQQINSVIKQLELDGFDLKDEGSLASYLGVQIEETNDGSLNLSQPGLTERIIEALGLSTSAAKDTPASHPIGRCANSPPATGKFNYRSVIGMMMYLGNNTRLDCSYAIHQCAQFCLDPRTDHEKAVKQIGRYLKGTADKGLIIKPTKSTAVDCYVDANFAGQWGFDPKEDPSCVCS